MAYPLKTRRNGTFPASLPSPSWEPRTAGNPWRHRSTPWTAVSCDRAPGITPASDLRPRGRPRNQHARDCTERSHTLLLRAQVMFLPVDASALAVVRPLDPALLAGAHATVGGGIGFAAI